MPAIDFPSSPTTGQVFAVETTYWVYDGTRWNVKHSGVDPLLRQISQNEKTVHGYGNGDCTSASYVNIITAGGTISLSFTKTLASSASNILITMCAGNHRTTGAGTAQFGVLLNGTDYTIIQGFNNETNPHLSWNNTLEITGIAAGTYTITGRWRTNSATMRGDANDPFSITAREKLI